MELHHCGVYLFKGLSELQTVISINRRSLAGRRFSAAHAGRKAKFVAPARGLQCRINLQ